MISASNDHEDQVPFLTASSQPMDMMEGDITSTMNRTNSNELSTLDEPVLETIKRRLSSEDIRMKKFVFFR